VGLGSQDALNPWILLLLAAPPPGCSSSWLLLLPAATHNNFSFNFSILSVIYTCHAMAVKLCPDPRCRDSPSGRSVSLVFCFFFWFFLSACRTAAFVFATAIALDYTLLINGRVRLKRRLAPVNRIKQQESKQFLNHSCSKGRKVIALVLRQACMSVTPEPISLTLLKVIFS